MQRRFAILVCLALIVAAVVAAAPWTAGQSRSATEPLLRPFDPLN